MNDDKRRTLDGWAGYLRIYWPLIVAMVAALGTYFKTSFLVENLVDRVSVLEINDKTQTSLIISVQRDGDGQKGTIMVIDERTKRMADDIRELRRVEEGKEIDKRR